MHCNQWFSEVFAGRRRTGCFKVYYEESEQSSVIADRGILCSRSSFAICFSALLPSNAAIYLKVGRVSSSVEGRYLKTALPTYYILLIATEMDSARNVSSRRLYLVYKCSLPFLRKNTFRTKRNCEVVVIFYHKSIVTNTRNCKYFMKIALLLAYFDICYLELFKGAQIFVIS